MMFMNQLPTLEDVARLSGTSRSTVSRVINNQGGVSDNARERILSAIDTLNYQPNRLARGLVTGQNQCLGVIVPRALTQVHSDPFFTPIMDSVYHVAHDAGLSIMLWIIETEAEGVWLDDHLSQTKQIDGVIMVPSLSSAYLFRRLGDYGLPCVTIGRFHDQQDNFIDIDNEGAAIAATEHLVALGYKRIATLTGRLDSNASRDRLLGMKRALTKANMAISNEWIIDCKFEEALAYHATAKLIKKKCDAIFCMNDSMAIGAIRAIQESGRRVPEHIGVIGFDDVPRSRAVQPALTTVRQPLYGFGEEAAKLLLEIMQAGPRNRDSIRPYVLLPTELIVRDSCGYKRVHEGVSAATV
jgi:LacI family transcriptional regulator